jgi:hypothetical protein
VAVICEVKGNAWQTEFAWKAQWRNKVAQSSQACEARAIPCRPEQASRATPQKTAVDHI